MSTRARVRARVNEHWRDDRVLEKDIERRLGERLRGLGCIYYKFTSPQQRGVPDRIVICPDGTLVFCELKKPGGRMAVLQSVQLARLRQRGQRTAEIWTEEAAEAFAGWVARNHCGRCPPGEIWRGGGD